MVDIDATRTDPPQVAPEREQLETWLDYHRATLLMKCAGLTDEQLRMRSAEPSTLSLLGLVRHMTDVESGWFSDFVGEFRPRYWSREHRDADFDEVDDADVEQAFAWYAEECDKSRAAAARHRLDDTYTDERGRTFDLRWLYLHMIEEYARHNGHADLIRERIDGAVGD